MLEAIRKRATGILSKVLIGLLVLSFAVWGVADMITGVGSSTIASVGDKEIGIYEFRQRYQEQVDLISNRFGQRLTPQQARTLGVENSVLSSMIGSRAIDTHAQDLKLSITDGAIEENILRDPLFQGLDGTFNPSRLEQWRTSIGLSEEQLVASRGADIIRDQLTGSMLENITVPPILYDIYHTFNEEKRKVRYFTIDPKTAIKQPDPPSDTLLKEEYETNKSRFMSEETRDVEILMLTREDAQNKLNVSEAQLKERYQSDKSRYSVPELRKILQIPFKSVELAKKARAEIVGGKDFAVVAKANKVEEADLDLGEITKAELVDPIIADAAFKLKKDEISDIVEGRFSTVLIKVTKITPGKVPAFAEVKDKIRDSITAAQVPDEIRKLHDLVDDNRLAGKSFQEIADFLKITFLQASSVNRSGNGMDGKPVSPSPELGKVMAHIFKSAVGIENEVIELSDGGYAWTKVTKLNVAEQRPFEAVKEEVKKIWLQQEESKAITKLAQDYVEKLKDGATFKKIAKAAGGEVNTTPAFKRNDSLPGLSPAAVKRAFTLAKGTPSAALSNDGKSRTIFEVTDIVKSDKIDADKKKQAEERLLQGLRADVIEQYILALRNRYGVDINQRLIDQTVGLGIQNGG